MRVPLSLLALLVSTAAAQKGADPLPITRVALYKNGVGFFEHTGRVTGDQSVSIDFTSAQLNDVLQSLTAIDLNGGRISGAGYNSTTPLDQQLRALPLGLSENASDVDFYNAVRGARVQVAGVGAIIRGRLLAIDLRQLPAKDGAAPITDHRYVTVISEAGLVRTLELTPTVSVTLLDTALHLDVNRYLELLASNRNQRLRHLTLLDRGTGPRELRVSYISEVPVWKSTYRLLLSTGAGDATLQGWSVVDNTTGSDWTNVHLDLIAGAPQSFIQPLSTPYYARRPEIPLPAEAQLEPQTHDSGASAAAEDGSATPAPGRSRSGETGPGCRLFGGHPRRECSEAAALHPTLASSTGHCLLQRPTPAPTMRSSPRRRSPRRPRLPPSTTTSSTRSPTPSPSARMNLPSSPSSKPNCPSNASPSGRRSSPPPYAPCGSPTTPPLRSTAAPSLSSRTAASAAKACSTPSTPGEKRLLSYAADQAVRVSTDFSNNTSKVTHLSVKKGVLTETSTDVSEIEYLVHNAAPEARTVIIEQPARQGWTLNSEVKPTETTPTANRFRVEAKPAETVRLHIGERHTNYQYVRLVDQSEDQLALLLRNAKASPATMTALQPVFDAHNNVILLDKQLQANLAEVNTITADQARLRENMKALKGSTEERDLLKRYTGELNQQEDRLASLRTQQAQLQTQRNTADANFQDKLAAVNLDEDL